MDATEIPPGLLALADQVYAGLLEEWFFLDELPRDPATFTAEFEMRLQEALEPKGDDPSDGMSGPGRR